MGFVATVIDYIKNNANKDSFKIKVLTPIIIFIILNWFNKNNMNTIELFLNFIATFGFGGLYTKYAYSEILKQVQENKNLVKYVVGVGLVLMLIILLTIFSYLGDNQALLHSSNVFLKIFLLVLLGIPLYNMLKNTDFIKKGSSAVKILFYGLFLIPCGISELVNKFIDNYRENKLSKFVMGVIMLEVIVLFIMSFS